MEPWLVVLLILIGTGLAALSADIFTAWYRRVSFLDLLTTQRKRPSFLGQYPSMKHGELLKLTNSPPHVTLTVKLREDSLLRRLRLKTRDHHTTHAQAPARISVGIASIEARFELSGDEVVGLLSFGARAREGFEKLTDADTLVMEEGRIIATWKTTEQRDPAPKIRAWLSAVDQWIERSPKTSDSLAALLLHESEKPTPDEHSKRCERALLASYPTSPEAAQLRQHIISSEKAAQYERLLNQRTYSPVELLRLAECVLCAALRQEVSTQDERALPSQLTISDPALGLRVELVVEQDVLHAVLRIDASAGLGVALVSAPTSPQQRAIDQARWYSIAATPQPTEAALWRGLFPAHTWSSPAPLEAALALSAPVRQALAGLVEHHDARGQLEGDQLKVEYWFNTSQHQPELSWAQQIIKAARALQKVEPSREGSLAQRTSTALEQRQDQEQRALLLSLCYAHDPALCAEVISNLPGSDRDEPARLAMRINCGERLKLSLDQLSAILTIALDPQEDGPVRQWALLALLTAAREHDKRFAQVIDLLNQSLLALEDDQQRDAVIEQLLRHAKPAPPEETLKIWALLSAQPRLSPSDQLSLSRAWEAPLRLVLLAAASDAQRIRLLEQLEPWLKAHDWLSALLFELSEAALTPAVLAQLEKLLIARAPFHEALPSLLVARFDAKRDVSDWFTALAAAKRLRARLGDAHDQRLAQLYRQALKHSAFEIVREAADQLLGLERLDESSYEALVDALLSPYHDEQLDQVIARLERTSPSAPSCFKAYVSALRRANLDEPARLRWFKLASEHPHPDKLLLWEGLAELVIKAPRSQLGELASAYLIAHAPPSCAPMQRVCQDWGRAHRDDETRVWAIEQLGPAGEQLALKALGQVRLQESLRIRLVDALIEHSALALILDELSRALTHAGPGLLGHITDRFVERRDPQLMELLLLRLEQGIQRGAVSELIINALHQAQLPEAQAALLARLGKTSPEVEQRILAVLAEVGVARTAVPALKSYQAQLVPLIDARRRAAVDQTIERLQARVSEQAQMGLEEVRLSGPAPGGLSTVREHSEAGALSLKDDAER